MSGAAEQLYREAPHSLRTIRDVVRFAVSRFGDAHLSFGHGSTNAWDEAVYLVLHSLKLPLDQLEPFLDARLTPGELEHLLDIVKRRCAHIPAAYLTHEAWLGPLSFFVDERVIVPRSFIAELLLEGLEPWIFDAGAVMHILDLCTGSGCLAILAAQQFPNSHIDAVDVSAQALEVARINLERHHESRVELIQSDLFEALATRSYDLILCNPPYVPDAAMKTLPEEYRHEPPLALAGGSDGLDIIRRVVAAAPRFLRHDGNQPGLLVIEVGNERAAFEASFSDLPCTWLPTAGSDDGVVLIEARDLDVAHEA